MRAKLLTAGGCDKPYKIHVDIKVESAGPQSVKARLTLAVYGKSGIAGTAPVNVSGNGVPDDFDAMTVVLRSAVDRAIDLYMQNFH